MASGPWHKHTDAALLDWARDWVRKYDETPLDLTYDIPTMAEVVRRFVELVEDERKRKGRPAHRPRGSGIGEMVEAKRTQGLNTTEARQAVAKEMGIPIKRVAQAHRRWLTRMKPMVRRRK